MAEEYVESKCGSCAHSEACMAWMRHGSTLYSDFSYSVADCPYYVSAADVAEVVRCKNLEIVSTRLGWSRRTIFAPTVNGGMTMSRLIDADEAIRIANEHMWAHDVDEVKFILDKCRTVEAEPIRYSWWQETEDGDWECASCKNAVTICVCGKDRTYRMERCPHCGARMAGGKKYGEELSQ